MKQLRWIIALAAAAVILTVVFIFVDKKDQEKKQKAEIGKGRQLWSIDSKTVCRITIDNDEGHFCFDWDEVNKVWKLTSADQFNLNTYAVASICNYICNVSTQKTIEFNAANPDIYGFDNPVEIRVYTESTDNKPYLLKVGDPTPTNDGFYVMTENSPDVCTVDYTTGGIFCVSKNTLKDNHFFNSLSSLISYYKVEKKGEDTLEIVRKEDYSWELKQPAPLRLMKSEVDNLFDIIVRVLLQDYVEENPQDLAKYGLDDPWAKVTIRDQANVPRSGEIWLGDPVSDDPNEKDIYGYFVKSKEVFRIQRADVSFLNNKLDEYVNPYCYPTDIADLTQIDIDMGSVYAMKETLHLDYANKQYSLGSTDITALNDDRISTLFQNLYRAVSTIAFSELDIHAEPSPDDPVMTFTYHYKDGHTGVMSFTKKADNNFYCFKDGVYTGMTVRLNHFTTQGGIVPSWETLKEALAGK